MIPAAHITHWAAGAPWPTRQQIEQDLILSRLIIEFACPPLLGEALAFRGGTCLHKLHLPTALRYSEDLDYVRTTAGPVGDIPAMFRSSPQCPEGYSAIFRPLPNKGPERRKARNCGPFDV